MNRKATLLRYGRHLLLAYGIVLIVNLMANGNAYLNGSGNWKTSLLFSFGITTLGWLSFTWPLQALLKRYFDWKNHPTRSFIFFLLFSALYGGLLMYAYIRIVTPLFHIQVRKEDYIINITFSILITLIITLIISLRYFLHQWKKGVDEAKELQEAISDSRYETLKNQVNPHFLFNALNTLTTLIHEDQHKAAAFVQQLSRVFRYALQYADQHTVDIQKELQVTDAFLLVCQQRFAGKLHYRIEVTETGQIMTHSLLMLVENAIKHNEISTARPLHIKVYTEDHYVCVANNLQVKKAIDGSNGIGLGNLQQRYRHITRKPVLVADTADQFIVKIPLLSDEDINSRR